MASVFWGVNRGQGTYDVVVDSSTQSTDFELEVDLANSPTRDEAIKAVTQILDKVLRGPWPPVG
jgi:hypothetical protein